MMTISFTTKVRDVAVELPQSTRLFEKFKIDYCCGGDQPLAAACASAGVDFRTLLQMIDQLRQAPEAGARVADLQNASATELIRYILRRHHAYTQTEMARLVSLTEKVVAAHGANHPELLTIRDLLGDLFAELTQHMFKEEQILFPFVIALDSARTEKHPAPLAPFGTVKNPISRMLTEHDNAGDLLRELRKLSADYRLPADACISYKTFYEALEAFEQDLHEHIHLENNILFPKAVALEAGS